MDDWIPILLAVGIIVIVSIVIYTKKRKSKINSLVEENNILEPNENSEQLKTFIEKCWGEGYSIPEIENFLLQKGWSMNTIKQMFYKSAVPNSEEKVTPIKRNVRLIKQKILPKTDKKILIVKNPEEPETKKEIKPSVIDKEIKTLPKKKVKVEDVSETNENEYTESEDITKLRKKLIGEKD